MIKLTTLLALALISQSTPDSITADLDTGIAFPVTQGTMMIVPTPDTAECRRMDRKVKNQTVYDCGEVPSHIYLIPEDSSPTDSQHAQEEHGVNSL